jgi:plastocyanin
MQKLLLITTLAAALACDPAGGTTSATAGNTDATAGTGTGTGTGTTDDGTGTTEPATTEPTTTAGTTTGGGALVNDCDPATAVDHTADAVTTINTVGLAYDPPCIKIAAGGSVKFVSDFAAHPLVGGVVEGGAKAPDAASPVTSTNTGTEATFVFASAGSFGYYCDFHALGGMVGAVFVE